MDWGNGPEANLSVFLSIPFCLHKCSYCDLNAYAGLGNLIPAYVDALIREIDLIGSGADAAIHTIYFGGGTPSVIPTPLLAQLFSAIRNSFRVAENCEISFEANPETLTAEYLDALKQLGVNRLSLGAQSAQANELALFQRTHTWADVERAVELARQARFDNLSLDLIYGLPGQTLARWQDTLARALALNPDHFSVYALSLDFNTPMRAWVQRGLLLEPDDDLAADMYQWADEELKPAGYEQYELSSWAKQENSKSQIPNFKMCKHNLQYWRNLPYLGLGAGAHGCWGGWRYSNVGNPVAYVNRMNSNTKPPFPFSFALHESSQIDYNTEMNETMLTGLRLVNEGVRAADFQARFGAGLRDVFAVELGDLEARGLVEWNEAGIRLTAESRFVSNWVFERFV